MYGERWASQRPRMVSPIRKERQATIGPSQSRTVMAARTSDRERWRCQTKFAPLLPARVRVRSRVASCALNPIILSRIVRTAPPISSWKKGRRPRRPSSLVASETTWTRMSSWIHSQALVRLHSLPYSCVHSVSCRRCDRSADTARSGKPAPRIRWARSYTMRRFADSRRLARR
jgi:hypothetical protein